MENGSSQSKIQEIGIYILLIFLVLILLVSFGKVDFLNYSPKPSKEDLENQKEKIDIRYNRIQKILEKKLWLKKRLQIITKRTLFGVRFVIVSFILSLFMIMLYFKVEPLNAIGYLSGMGILICLLFFLFIGSPKSISDLWEVLKKNIEISIYKKYIDIDVRIEKDLVLSKELIQSKEEIESALRYTFNGN